MTVDESTQVRHVPARDIPVPAHLSPDSITLEQALGLLEARSARGGGKRRAAAKARDAARKAEPKKAAKPSKTR